MSFSRRLGNTASQRKNPFHRKPALQLAAVVLVMLAGMTAYESLKHVILPNISLWESHLITILFSTICAATGAYFMLAGRNKAERQYRAAIEYSNDGVIMVHDKGYLYVNQRFLDIFGYESREEVIGKPLTINVHPDDRERVADMYRRRQEGQSVPSSYEFKGIRKNGEQVFIEISVAGITCNNRRVSLGYMRDISDRKRMEEERLYSAKLESALEMAGTVCHELNQPLQIISSNSDLLMMTDTEDSSTTEKLETIKQQAMRMGAITRRLMGFRRYSTRDYVGTTKIINLDVKPGNNN